MEADFVVSPYSSFLALAVEPKAAVRNLRRLCSLGFTAALGSGRPWTTRPRAPRAAAARACAALWRTTSGMSLTAVANCLLDDIMCRRFMSDPAMSAHRCLLEERLPIGAVTLRRRGAEPPEKPQRAPGAGWELGGSCPDAAYPDCYPVSNGVYHLMLTSIASRRPSPGA